MSFHLIRAVVVTAFFHFSVATSAQSPVSAKPPTKAAVNSRSETYKDIIEKAYNLSLQKDRPQALNILSAALLRETRTAASADLKKTISEITNVFLSDKAQQLYEASISLRKTDLNQAFDKIVEASRIEADNSLIVNELTRVMIARGDCKNAQDTAQKQLQLVKFDEDLKLSMAQSLACQGKWAEYQKIFESVQVKKSPQQIFWLALEIEKQLSSKSMTKAQESLMALKKLDEKYPEAFYWLWKFHQAQGQKQSLAQKHVKLEEAQKYLVMCKNISANHYRQYMIDPMLCRRVSDVEGDLKGMNGTPE